MEDEWAEGITPALRKIIHAEGFLCEDEIKEDENGSTWVKVDFFDNIMNILKKFGLISGDNNGEV